MRFASLRRPSLLLAGLAVLSACIVSSRVDVVPVRSTAGVRVQSPVKAHLHDGTTVVYRHGMEVVDDTIVGDGMRYSLTLRDSAPVARLPVAMVLGMETFRREVNAGRTLLYSTLATAGALGATVGIACAMDPKCFGSCPTFYADSADGVVLEAEGFSYSVAPLLEARDVDRLRLRADASGRVRLHVWNEALETHYINHLALLEVRHGAGAAALPDARNAPVVVGALRAPAHATDRAGRDILPAVARHDGVVFASDDSLMRAVRADDLHDRLDVVFPAPRGRDSAAVVLRLRNSLLNTVLFYDRMLAEPGARSLDWLGRDLDRVGAVAELGRWYAARMGLRVSVWDGAAWREADRVADAGPIAFRDVAVVVPVPAAQDSLRVRITFVADDWRIDRVALADDVRRVAPRTLPLAGITDATGVEAADALATLREPDERYLVTQPRQRFTARFEAGAAPAGDSTRTFLLVSQGYYIEWVRGAWLAGVKSPTPFVPSDSALAGTVHAWLAQRTSLERSFYASRVPVQ